jgi:hypothetical protein
VEAPDYASDHGSPSSPTPRQRRAFVIALVAVPLVLVITALAFGVTSRDDDDTADAPDSSTELAGLAPTDGKDSQRLPVTITPHRDLEDGQVVTVSGSGFPPNVEIAFATCTNGAETYGIDSCDLSTSTYMNGRRIVTSADGTFSEPYTVRRHLVVNGVPVDCARGNLDPDAASPTNGPPTTMPGDFTCVIGGGVLADYDISGGGPVSFAGAEFTAGINPPPQTGSSSPIPTSSVTSEICPNTTEYEVLTEEHGGTTMTVMVPPTPIYGPCVTTVP